MIPGILLIRRSEWVICIKKESYIQNNYKINANPVNILHCTQLMIFPRYVVPLEEPRGKEDVRSQME